MRICHTETVRTQKPDTVVVGDLFKLSLHRGAFGAGLLESPRHHDRVFNPFPAAFFHRMADNLRGQNDNGQVGNFGEVQNAPVCHAPAYLLFRGMDGIDHPFISEEIHRGQHNRAHPHKVVRSAEEGDAPGIGNRIEGRFFNRFGHVSPSLSGLLWTDDGRICVPMACKMTGTIVWCVPNI